MNWGLCLRWPRVIEESLAGEDVTAVDTVVMEIGEVSSVVPHYFESCFPAARSGRCSGTRSWKWKLSLPWAAANAAARSFPSCLPKATAPSAAASTRSCSAGGSSTSGKCG